VERVVVLTGGGARIPPTGLATREEGSPPPCRRWDPDFAVPVSR
jgi:hypothetical protein